MMALALENEFSLKTNLEGNFLYGIYRITALSGVTGVDRAGTRTRAPPSPRPGSRDPAPGGMAHARGMTASHVIYSHFYNRDAST